MPDLRYTEAVNPGLLPLCRIFLSVRLGMNEQRGNLGALLLAEAAIVNGFNIFSLSDRRKFGKVFCPDVCSKSTLYAWVVCTRTPSGLFREALQRTLGIPFDAWDQPAEILRKVRRLGAQRKRPPRNAPVVPVHVRPLPIVPEITTVNSISVTDEISAEITSPAVPAAYDPNVMSDEDWVDYFRTITDEDKPEPVTRNVAADILQELRTLTRILRAKL